VKITQFLIHTVGASSQKNAIRGERITKDSYTASEARKVVKLVGRRGKRAVELHVTSAELVAATECPQTAACSHGGRWSELLVPKLVPTAGG
jgi:hypothetical protein